MIHPLIFQAMVSQSIVDIVYANPLATAAICRSLGLDPPRFNVIYGAFVASTPGIRSDHASFARAG